MGLLRTDKNELMLGEIIYALDEPLAETEATPEKAQSKSKMA
jgi:hypothetical protein